MSQCTPIGFTDIGTLGGTASIATDCSADGSVIVGGQIFDLSEDASGHAFKYNCNCIVFPMITPITFVIPPVNPQTGDYNSSRLTNDRANKVIRVYTTTNRCPVFNDYATYMRYLTGALRF